MADEDETARNDTGRHDMGRYETDCDRALVELYEFLDGELTLERRQRIELHLNDCRHCFSSFDFEQGLRLVVRLRLQTPVVVPPDLVARVASLIDFESRGLNRPS